MDRFGNNPERLERKLNNLVERTKINISLFLSCTQKVWYFSLQNSCKNSNYMKHLYFNKCIYLENHQFYFHENYYYLSGNIETVSTHPYKLRISTDCIPRNQKYISDDWMHQVHAYKNFLNKHRSLPLQKWIWLMGVHDWGKQQNHQYELFRCILRTLDDIKPIDAF